MSLSNRIIKELNEMRYDEYLSTKIECSEEEVKKYKKIMEENNNAELPPDVEEGINNEFYKYYTPLNNAELIEYLLHTQNKDLKTIKNCIVFFTITFIINIGILVIYFLYLFSR